MLKGDKFYITWQKIWLIYIDIVALYFFKLCFSGATRHGDSVGSQLLQGWIWLVLANFRWRRWQPIRDHCFSGRVSLTATNMTDASLHRIQHKQTDARLHRRNISVFVQKRSFVCIVRLLLTFERKKKRSFVCIVRLLLANTTHRCEGLCQKHACGRYAYLLCSCLLPLRYLIVVRLDISPFFPLRLSHTEVIICF